MTPGSSDSKVYSLQKSIREFFKSGSTTQVICDARALELVGGSTVVPVPVQGSWSYNVFAGLTLGHVVQFRGSSQPLDMRIAALAMASHPGFVPKITFHGKLGGNVPYETCVLVYVMDRVPGETYLEFTLRNCLDTGQEIAWRRTLMADVARFYAQAWNTTQVVDRSHINTVYQKCTEDLHVLLKALQPRFQPVIQKCIDHLPMVFKLPMVITHPDFGPMNMIVDPETSHLTGVIDWAYAEVLPFGHSIHRIEWLCGSCDLQTGWTPYVDHADLRALFWKTLLTKIEEPISAETLKAIRMSSIIGLLLEKGFNLRKEPREPIIDDNDGNYNMFSLEAFLIGSELKFDEA